jgi:pimeloyl-ACP methyl ester carboxylesterase
MRLNAGRGNLALHKRLQNLIERATYHDKLFFTPVTIDPEAPLQCSLELLEGIPDARLIVFEQSGHAPFVEERVLFADTLARFLSGP